MPLCKNLASGKLASNISSSTTTLSVYVGSGSSTTIKNVWPSTPFYVTIMPENPTAGVPNSLDSEIVKVTAVGTSSSNTTLTVTRGQRNTTAKAFTAGAIVSNASYADDAPILDETWTEESETPWVSGSMIENGAVSTHKIQNEAITSGKIDFSTFPKVVAVGATDFQGTVGTSPTTIKTMTLNGLIPGQKYLALAKIRLAQAYNAIGLAGFPEVGIAEGEMRFYSDHQSSPMSIGIFTASSSSMTIRLRGWATVSTTMIFENPIVYAIPIQTNL